MNTQKIKKYEDENKLMKRERDEFFKTITKDPVKLYHYYRIRKK